MVRLAESLTADDPRYDELVKLDIRSTSAGVDLDQDYSDALNALRNRAPVLKGGLRSLLGVPDHKGAHSVEREKWTLLSYAACEQGFRDNTTFSSMRLMESGGGQLIGSTILNLIGKEHRNHRAVAQPLFLRPRVFDWWKRLWIDGTVEALLDRLAGRDAVDLNLELCARLPMFVVTRALGLGGEDALHFRIHLTRSTFGAHSATPEQVAESREVVARILTDLVTARRAEPRDDLISGVLGNDLKLVDGTTRKLTDEEVFSFCRLLVFAGGGTTWRQLGITIDALLTHYHFWEECRENRSLLDQAVDESLRWRANDPVFPRLTVKDVEVCGVVIPGGSHVDVCVGAANRDPDVFERPDEYDIHRPRHQHLGFGVGPHRCIGIDVAKQEIITAISGLMDRWPKLRLDPDQPKPRFRGLEHRLMTAVPVRLQ